MINSQWKDSIREIILEYNKHRISDPFMTWFRQKDKEKAFANDFERILIILIDARFDQQTTADKALENTRRVFEAGVLKRQLDRSEIPSLIPRQRMTAEKWTNLFYVAIPRLYRLATEIGRKRTWTAQELLRLMHSSRFKVPYLGVKTSRLAVRWLYELVPNLKIDMQDFKVPVDRLVYRVACRLGIINPRVDKYYGEGSPADLKIQTLAKTLFPNDPWFLDEPLWSTGRQASKGGHCYPTHPRHDGCIFETICQKKFNEFDPSGIGMQEEPRSSGWPSSLLKPRGYKTHAELIREAIEKLGEATPREIMHFIRNQHPEIDVKETSFRADIIGCSINHTSSHHYPGMPKFLFYEKQKGTYRLYNPKIDGKHILGTEIRVEKIARLASSLDEKTIDKLIEFLVELKKLRKRRV